MFATGVQAAAANGVAVCDLGEKLAKVGRIEVHWNLQLLIGRKLVWLTFYQHSGWRVGEVLQIDPRRVWDVGSDLATEDRLRIEFEDKSKRLLRHGKLRYSFAAVPAFELDLKVWNLLFRAARLQAKKAAIWPPVTAQESKF